MGAEIIQNISQPQEHTSPEAAQLEGTFASLCTGGKDHVAVCPFSLVQALPAAG